MHDCLSRHSAKEVTSANELSDFHHVNPDSSPKGGDSSIGGADPVAEEPSSSVPVPKLAPRPVLAIAGKGEKGYAH